MIQVLTTDQPLYYEALGRLVRVTAIADTDIEANAHMATTPGQSVLVCLGAYVLMADAGDNRSRRLVLREIARTMEAAPGGAGTHGPRARGPGAR